MVFGDVPEEALCIFWHCTRASLLVGLFVWVAVQALLCEDAEGEVDVFQIDRDHEPPASHGAATLAQWPNRFLAPFRTLMHGMTSLSAFTT